MNALSEDIGSETNTLDWSLTLPVFLDVEKYAVGWLTLLHFFRYDFCKTPSEQGDLRRFICREKRPESG